MYSQFGLLIPLLKLMSEFWIIKPTKLVLINTSDPIMYANKVFFVPYHS